MPFQYEYPHLAVTVDCVVFGLDGQQLKVLLIRRQLPPFQHRWALPGGYVRMDETLDAAASRELREEAGLEQLYLEQLYTFGSLDRDPRERTVSVAYFALVQLARHSPSAGGDASEASWFPVDTLPDLAFDHQRIIAVAQERLRGKVRYQPIGFELLPACFTLTQLQTVYEAILGESLDKRNFRRKILSMDILEDTGRCEINVSHRAARLYQFNRRQYSRLLKKGFHFEV